MTTYKLLKPLPNYGIGKFLEWNSAKNAYVNKTVTTDGLPVLLGSTTVQGDITWFEYQIGPDITAAISLLQGAGYIITAP